MGGSWNALLARPRRPRQLRRLRLESLETRTLLAGDLIISELTAKNDSTLADEDGDWPDWIEIFNQGPTAADLAGHYLSDDPLQLTKWQFPARPLDAGEAVVVFASDKNRAVAGSPLHTNFKLAGGGEYLALIDADGSTVLHEYAPGFPGQYTDVSYGLEMPADPTPEALVPDGAAASVLVPNDGSVDAIWREPTFVPDGNWIGGTTGVGYDTEATYDGLIHLDVEAAMLDNGTSAFIRFPFDVVAPDELVGLTLRMRYDDGFVAYLNGVRIADANAPEGVTWQSAATALHDDADAVVPVEYDIASFIPVLQSGANVLAVHGLNASIGSSDFLIVPELTATRTAGATDNARFFPVPTPGYANGGGILGLVGDTHFSVDRGLYGDPFQVAVTSDTPGATIRYTTDGSEPTETHGQLYGGPIDVTTTTTLRAAAFLPGYQPSNVDTQTYLFPGHVAAQTTTPAGYPAGWDTIAADYEVDPDVTNNPLYAGTFEDDLQTVPSISLVMDVDDWFGVGGIYVNPLQRGVEWERPVSIELLNPDGVGGFQIDAGVRIFGGVSRNLPSTPKKSFRLLFKSEYGASKLDYPFFDDTTVDRFDELMLRGGYNYKWTHGSGVQQTRAQYMRDQFSRDSQLAMGQPASHGRYMHVYLNGLYWGMYNAVERPDEAFAASYFGGEKEDYDVIKHGDPPEAIRGDRVAWDAMFALAKDAGRTADQKYVDIQQYLDVDNLIDYMIAIHYTGNVDAPVLIGSTTSPRNFYASSSRLPGGQFRFFLWDSEHSLSETGVDRTELGVGNADDTPARLYGELRDSAEFRLRFADHVHKFFFNEGVLTPEKSVERWMDIAGEIDRAIVGESARWGDVRRAAPYTRDVEWLAEQNRLTTQFFPGRHDAILNQWSADGLYPSVGAPTFSRHGGTIADTFDLTMAAEAGTAIYYTLDGSDPRLPGGQPAPNAAVYGGGPIPLDASTIVKARALDGADWSALTEASFTHVDVPPLRITELMYHPADPAVGDGADLEFIELANVGNEPIELGGFRFTEGIDFTFPAATLLPDEYVVVVSDTTAFAASYGGGAVVLGQYAGQLDNAGERLRLEGRVSETIHDFEYDDAWHPITDGDGYSLVVVDPTADPTAWGSKAAWRPSETRDGAPGSPDHGFVPGSVVVNEVQANVSAAPGDWIELHNTTDGSVDVGGWYVSDSAAALTRYRIPDAVEIPAHGFLVLTRDGHFGPVANPAGGFEFSPIGGAVYLTSPGDAAGVGGYRDSVRFDGVAGDGTNGRFVNSAGRTDFVPLVAATPDAPNSPPALGPVVINEIMYHPADGGIEFIELYNRTAGTVPLFNPANPVDTWRFTNGIEFVFPTGVTLTSGEYLIVAPTDEATFRATYDVPAGVSVIGPFSGMLDDGGERVALSMPALPVGDGAVPLVLSDHVRYDDEAPWWVLADGAGSSLNRLDAAAYGNEVLNWAPGSSGGSPGVVNEPIDVTPPTVPTGLTASRVGDRQLRLAWQPSTDADSGVARYRVYLDETPVATALETSFTAPYSSGSTSLDYRVSAVNGDGIESGPSAALPTATAQFQNGTAYAGADDTFLSQADASTAFGDAEVLFLDHDESDPDRNRRALLRWDVSDLPRAASVIDGSISLHVEQLDPGRTYYAFQMHRDWVEGQATWDVFADGTAWENPGADGPADRGDVALGHAAAQNNGELTVSLNAAGVALVQDWTSDPAGNRGLILVDAAAVPDVVAITSGLVANYTFDSGTDDAVGGFDATASGATSAAEGKFGGAFAFDGVYDFVALPSAVTAGRQEFSIALWVKTAESRSGTAFYTNPTLIGQESSGGGSGDLGITTQGGNAAYWHGLAGDQSFASTTPVNDGIWHSFVLTSDGIETRLWIDGLPVNASARTAGGPLSSQAFYVGNQSGGKPAPGQADVDDLGVWNRPLNAAEIAHLWNEGAGRSILTPPAEPAGPPEAMPTPVIHWNFDDTLENAGSGGVAYDATIVGDSAVFIDGRHVRALDLQNSPGSATGGQHVGVDYSLPDSGTVALWYYVDPYYNYQSVFDNSADPNDWEFWIYNDGRAAFRVEADTFISYDLDNLDGPNHWYHFAATWNRNGSSVDVALFVDGQQRAARSGTWIDPGASLFLGGGNGGNTYGTGSLDDARIYDSVLSAEQIEQLAVDMSAGLVSYWALDDGLSSGVSTTAADAAGTNDGTLVGFGSPPSWSDGAGAKIGGALHLDGTDDYVLIPNGPSLNIATNAVTLSAWVNLDVLPGAMDEGFGSIFNSVEDSYILYLDRGAAELRFKVTDSDGTAQRPGIPESSLTAGTWHHVIGVYDGTAGQARIYLDGQLADTHADANLTGSVKSGQTAALGRDGTSPQAFLHGAVDEMGLWDRALAGVEIERLWNLGQGLAFPFVDEPAAAALTVSSSEAAIAARRPKLNVIYVAMPQVVGRHVFYNGSAFDGGEISAGVADDAAIAIGKSPLLPGHVATPVNFTHFDRGVNGVMIDVDHLADSDALTTADFAFRVGNGGDPTSWIEAPEPESVTVRRGQGSADADRVTLVWPDRAVQNQWLQVTVRATAATGLPADDVFYFGNAVGDTGNSSTDALVNAADVIAIRDNPRGPANPASIDSPHDINRDRNVDALDMILARNNATSPLSALRSITPSATPAAAPPVAAEDGTFRPVGEGESRVATGSSPSTDIASLDGVMAAQANLPAADSLLPPLCSKLLRRFGSAGQLIILQHLHLPGP